MSVFTAVMASALMAQGSPSQEPQQLIPPSAGFTETAPPQLSEEKDSTVKKRRAYRRWFKPFPYQGQGHGPGRAPGYHRR